MPLMLWEMESASTQCFSEPAWDIPRSMDLEKDLARKTQVTGGPTGGGLAIGLGKADLQICSHQETISSALEGK